MPGILIALEGIDGSGKGTQAALLHERLKQAGVRTKLLSFPRYQDTAFGREIGRFLNGEFGSLDQVHPLLASLLFAGDRFESRDLIQSSLAEHDIVICDRYVASNIAHQAAKRTGGERRELIAWIERLEFDIHQLPRPQLTIWLDVPVATAQELIARKAKRSYTDQKADLQEADGAYLQSVADVYAELANAQPHWRRIACTVSRDAEALRSGALRSEDSTSRLTDGILRDVTDIAADVFDVVKSPSNSKPTAPGFADLVASRKTWLAEFLEPWCRSAARKDLLLAEQEWMDIAGKVDPEKTLWKWAWSRFPDLVHESLGIDETSEVVVRLKDGREIRGFPDARKSLRGQLTLLTTDERGRFTDAGPFSLDDIVHIQRSDSIDPAGRGVS